MTEIKDNRIEQFLEALASQSATPGGGSAAAIIGAMGAALVSMVCNLTIGKKKYAEVEGDMKQVLAKADVDLVAKSRAPEVGVELRPQAEDWRFHADRGDDDRLGPVLDAVVLHLERQELHEVGAKTVGVDLHRAEQVDVARRARVGAQPVAQEQRALEYEAVTLRGSSGRCRKRCE